MRAERAFPNRCEFDLAMRDIHEWPLRREAFARGTCGCGGPQRVQSAAKGFSSKPLAGADPRAAWSMSISARSATGTCRWPG